MRLLSLFSGLGAFERGLDNLGIDYDLVAYCDFDRVASKAYSLLHGVAEDKNLGDVTKVREDTIPDFDLMTYGFPCQSFSIAGKRLGFEDETRGNLFFDAMRVAKAKKPLRMIGENVKGLLTHDKGRTFATVLDTLDSLGYNTYYQVLNSADFDVPQARHRVFLVSLRKDIDSGTYKFPVGKRTSKVVADIVDWSAKGEGITRFHPYLDTRFHKEYGSREGIVKVFDGSAQGCCSYGYDSWNIYSTQGLSPTLRTNKNNTFFLEVARFLTPLEWFSLQGFDDRDFLTLEGVAKSQLKKLAGNSITISVIQAVIDNLFL
jgi:DNA (cytosine-5)-methyltransferase 1